MKANFLTFGMMIAACTPVAAQEPQKPPVSDQEIKITSDEKAVAIRALVEKARIKQQGIDQRNQNLWIRWTYAVCIGCGPIQGKIRVVRTNPLRVLMGIPAAEDDAHSGRDKLRI